MSETRTGLLPWERHPRPAMPVAEVSGAPQMAGGSFAAVGVSTAPFSPVGAFNAAVNGTFVATLVLQRQFDNDLNWYPVIGVTGAQIQFTAPGSIVVAEPEAGVLYRFDCTSWTSGTALWRLSQ